jgi:hypothetical protein
MADRANRGCATAVTRDRGWIAADAATGRFRLAHGDCCGIGETFTLTIRVVLIGAKKHFFSVPTIFALALARKQNA